MDLAAAKLIAAALALLPLLGVGIGLGLIFSSYNEAVCRNPGAMELLVKALAPVLSPIGFPAEALPMALIRPLSGSGALAVMAEAMKTYGPDSFIGYLVSVINGGTETTFYVLALYFGAVQVKSMRHTLAACIATDFVGPLGAFIACKIFFANVPMVFVVG